MKNQRWNCKLTMKFVKFYLRKECLWNPKHENYKDAVAKKQAYSDIIDAMKNYVNIDMNGVRTKIKNLRGTYLQEINKIVKRSTDPDNVYEPSLPWFWEMDKYLKDIIMSNVDRPDTKWGKQCDELYKEEHLKDLMEHVIEGGESVVENQNDEDVDNESDISDFLYRDTFGTRWSGDLTLKFVKCYLKQECLWNTRHVAYTNKKKKLLAYQGIIDSMRKYLKLDLNAVRYKIRNLRSTYNQELLKIMRKSTDPDNIYIPNMPWFRLMDEKLKDVVQLRSRLIKTDFKLDTLRRKDTSSKNVVDEETLKNIKQDVDFMEEDHLHQDEDIMENMTTMETHDDDGKEVNSLFPPSHNTKAVFFEDEYDIFGQYIAAQLRKLKLKRSLQAKADILSVLSKARLDSL